MSKAASTPHEEGAMMARVAGPFDAEKGPLLKSPSEKGSARTEEVSSLKMMAMTIFAFPISMIWATMGMVILPAEALRLNPSNEALCLGCMMVVVAFSQLICPLVGQCSDRCRSAWGKRRPYIMLGTLMALAFAVGLWYSSVERKAWLFFFCLLMSQIGLNVIYTAQAALVPDTVQDDMGSTSGIVAVWQLAGNFTGMIFLVVTHQMDYHVTYISHLVLLTLAAVVVAFIKERPTDSDPAKEPLTLKSLMNSFSLGDDVDFYYVFVGRTFFYISMSSQAFSYYYYRDMLHVEDQNEIRKKLAILCLLGTFIAMFTAYPLGKLSDDPRVGRKPLIYIACAAMATVYFGYTAVPLLFELGTPAANAVYALGRLYGLGIAGYTSVDYALAVDCLPEGVGASEALGLWGIAGFVGSSIGPFLGGAILQAHALPGGGYSYQGYTCMMTMGIISFGCCAVVTSWIKKVN